MPGMPQSHEDIPANLDDVVRFGTVLTRNGAFVTVKCGDIVSPPLPLITFAGGWKSRVPPALDQQVTILCPSGDIAGGVVIGGLPCNAFASIDGDDDTATLEAPDSATFSYDPAAHVLTLTLPAGGKVNIVADGGFDFQGDVKITGKLEVTDDVTLGAKLAVTDDVTLSAKLDVAGDSTLGEGAILPVLLSDMSPSEKVKAK